MLILLSFLSISINISQIRNPQHTAQTSHFPQPKRKPYNYCGTGQRRLTLNRISISTSSCSQKHPPTRRWRLGDRYSVQSSTSASHCVYQSRMLTSKFRLKTKERVKHSQILSYASPGPPGKHMVPVGNGRENEHFSSNLQTMK